MADHVKPSEPGFKFPAKALVKIVQVVPEVFDVFNTGQGEDYYEIPCPMASVPCLKSVTFLDNQVFDCLNRIALGHCKGELGWLR